MLPQATNYCGLIKVLNGDKEWISISYDSINRYKKYYRNYPIIGYLSEGHNPTYRYNTFIYDGFNRIVRTNTYDAETNKLFDYTIYTYNQDSTLATDSSYRERADTIGIFVLINYNIYTYNASKQIYKSVAYDANHSFYGSYLTYYIYSLDTKGNIVEWSQYNSADSSLLSTATYTFDNHKKLPLFNLESSLENFNKNNILSSVFTYSSGAIGKSFSNSYTYNSDDYPLSCVEDGTTTITYHYDCW